MFPSLSLCKSPILISSPFASVCSSPFSSFLCHLTIIEPSLRVIGLPSGPFTTSDFLTDVLNSTFCPFAAVACSIFLTLLPCSSVTYLLLYNFFVFVIADFFTFFIVCFARDLSVALI